MKRKRHEKINRIINEWMYPIKKNCDGSINKITLSFEVCWRYVYIYTDRPGIFIGFHGKNIDKLEKLFKENNIHKKIRFIEVSSYAWATEITTRRHYLF